MSLPEVLPELPELPPLPAAPPPEAHAPTRPIETPEVTLRVGDVINARYRIEATIGQGGMSTVFRAQDLELDEPVAIKLFGLDADDAQMLLRFKQEVSLSRQLTHANIVRLHDIGLWSGRRFITMELLEGQSLTDWMRGRVPLATGLRVMVQACTALGVAHAAGVVHRDVKPDNFFVTRAGIVKLMDFGIAKRRAEPSKTQAGFTAGTPAYIAPEQISNFTGATHRADLYALGVMMFEMFTGRVPFEHEELMALLMAHVKEPPPSPASLRDDLPPELDALILQLLAKDPDARPDRAEEVVLRLRSILAGVTARG
ncbi:MAG: serine/threonine-protein kinase [Polyangiales bacterium]